jgi:hypothetical protein
MSNNAAERFVKMQKEQRMKDIVKIMQANDIGLFELSRFVENYKSDAEVLRETTKKTRERAELERAKTEATAIKQTKIEQRRSKR